MYGTSIPFRFRWVNRLTHLKSKARHNSVNTNEEDREMVKEGKKYVTHITKRKEKKGNKMLCEPVLFHFQFHLRPERVYLNDITDSRHTRTVSRQTVGNGRHWPPGCPFSTFHARTSLFPPFRSSSSPPFTRCFPEESAEFYLVFYLVFRGRRGRRAGPALANETIYCFFFLFPFFITRNAFGTSVAQYHLVTPSFTSFDDPMSCMLPSLEQPSWNMSRSHGVRPISFVDARWRRQRHLRDEISKEKLSPILKKKRKIRFFCHPRTPPVKL